MMSNSVLSRENNSIRNDAMPVLWKENTFIILKSIYSRAFIEKCHDSLVDNVKNGQELQMDVVIDMIKKAFSWNDIQWIEEEELLNNIERLKLILNQKGLKQQVKLLNHIVSIINGDREEVIEINDDYLSKIFKPYVIGGNDRAINNNNGYLQDRVIKEYMKKQDKDIQKIDLKGIVDELLLVTISYDDVLGFDYSTISNSIACVSTFSHNSMVHMQNKGVDMFFNILVPVTKPTILATEISSVVSELVRNKRSIKRFFNDEAAKKG